MVGSKALYEVCGNWLVQDGLDHKDLCLVYLVIPAAQYGTWHIVRVQVVLNETVSMTRG